MFKFKRRWVLRTRSVRKMRCVIREQRCPEARNPGVAHKWELLTGFLVARSEPTLGDWWECTRGCGETRDA